MKNKQPVTYPEKILPTVRSDMMAYHKHGYTFDMYVERNTYGRNYGQELLPIWIETKEEYDRGRDQQTSGNSGNRKKKDN